MKQADVNATLTVFLVALAVPYSSEVQQPMRATAVLGGRPRMRLAGSVDREQGRASSLHPDGQGQSRTAPGRYVTDRMAESRR